MTFEVERPEPGRQARTVTLTVTPDDVPAWIEPLRPFEPLEVPGLGLAYHVAAHVEDVAPGSPAAKAGLKKGDTINAMTFLPTEDAKENEKEKAKAMTSPSRSSSRKTAPTGPMPSTPSRCSPGRRCN